MKSKHILPVLVSLSSVFILICSIQKIHAAELLPSITLAVPQDQQNREYLGLGTHSGEEFNISEIQTDILLIQLFSMYCPYCQAEAPRVNRFYQLAEQYKEKGVAVKIIGLGASNTQFEVDYFKESYEIEFPLFPDKTLSMYKMLGGGGTPGFIGCVYKKGKIPEIILREPGGFGDPEKFLTQLLQKAGHR